MPSSDASIDRRPCWSAHPAAAPAPRQGGLTRWCNVPAWARATIALAGLATWQQAPALQLIEASDGVAAEAIVSLKEPTRLRIDGAPITDVFGNIHSSHCGVAVVQPLAAPSPGTSGLATNALATPVANPAGDVIVTCDRDKGEVYLRPVGDSGRPINLFVSSATATYTLLLRRADTPADTIVIRDKTPRALRSPAADTAPAGPAPNHVRTMKALLVAMASDRVPADIRVEELSRPVQLWAEARLTLLRQYEGRGFVGEKYLIENVSPAPLVLAEQEFDRPDSRAGGEVTGVAVEHHSLRPGESTSVYVLRRGGPR